MDVRLVAHVRAIIALVASKRLPKSNRQKRATEPFSFLWFFAIVINMQELAAKSRTELGRKVNALRRAGFLPAVVYGEGSTGESIAVTMRDFEKIYREAGESSVIELRVEGGKNLNVMIHDVAYDPLTSKPIHADFYSVRMDKEIETKVSLVFAGESPAIKGEGGILVKVMHEIDVKALPKDLPHEIKVDIAFLDKIDARIYVKDLILPHGVKSLAEAQEVVALVEAPRSEEELKALEAETVPEAAEVKTAREAKVEEVAKTK